MWISPFRFSSFSSFWTCCLFGRKMFVPLAISNSNQMEEEENKKTILGIGSIEWRILFDFWFFYAFFYYYLMLWRVFFFTCFRFCLNASSTVMVYRVRRRRYSVAVMYTSQELSQTTQTTQTTHIYSGCSEICVFFFFLRCLQICLDEKYKHRKEFIHFSRLISIYKWNRRHINIAGWCAHSEYMLKFTSIAIAGTRWSV